ncbi:uncharacterized protein LOC103383808 [Cynoglossus semilaevis]|uniref:uncharacterized protein LOC103383808 n=1 Tax=Cynoglossus semilaevis TaxID=244447 RepID=UPI0004973FAE|nr:uncharacterized protein LOC103383808 [Cynoglossus semilaevis]
MDLFILLLIAGLVGITTPSDHVDVTVEPQPTEIDLITDGLDLTDFPDFTDDMSELPTNVFTDGESETTMTTESTTGTSTTAAITATTVAVTTTTSTDEEGTLNMKFSMNRTYISDYADSTSDAYKTLETEVTDEIDKAGNSLYPSTYKGSTVTSFTEGSVVVESVLRFEKSSVPSVSASSLAFLSKLQDTGLGFISGSLDISATSGSPNVPSANILIVVAVTLLTVTQMLTP